MKITLISPYTDITSFGVRTLSAYLKQNGHKVQLIFLPDPYGDDLIFGVQRYPKETLAAVAELSRQSDLIGVSVMTNFFDGAAQITRELKNQLPTPVIWGGVHPTIRPEESLAHADMVCIGEGEEALLALVNRVSEGLDYLQTPNIWFKQNGDIIENALLPLPKDLDVFPIPDYSMADHHILIDDRVVPLTHEMTKAMLSHGTVSAYLGRTGYQTMTSRGCPYGCAYCINSTINKIYGRKGKLRWRSVQHVMAELKWVRSHMPYIDYIWLSDDEFMARKIGDLREFARQYKEKIGLPFSCLVSPLSVTEEKMALLVDAGLVYVQMGVESASPRMQEIYNRKHMPNARMMKAVRIINKFKDRMVPPSYDFLIDAPYETLDDKIDSLRFISNIPKPYRLQPFVLILYPGTQLYLMAKRDGLISDEQREIYNKSYTMRAPTYPNLLITLARKGRFPGPLLKLLIRKPVVHFFNRPALKRLVTLLYFGMKNVYNLFKRGRSAS